MIRSYRLAAALLGLLFVSLAATACAFQDGDSLESNLALQQQLLRTMASEALASSGVAPGAPVVLRVDTLAESWITQQAFASSLRSAGHEVVLADGALPSERVVIEVRRPSLSVRYSDPTEDGLFGKRRVRRTVSAEASCLVTLLPGGAVRMSETLTRSHSDTVRVDGVPGIESAGINCTRGELPQDRFIDRIIEPFVIVGATGVAVYLLFNIRS